MARTKDSRVGAGEADRPRLCSGLLAKVSTFHVLLHGVRTSMLP
jgi:hypothetical protein